MRFITVLLSSRSSSTESRVSHSQQPPPSSCPSSTAAWQRRKVKSSRRKNGGLDKTRGEEAERKSMTWNKEEENRLDRQETTKLGQVDPYFASRLPGINTPHVQLPAKRRTLPAPPEPPNIQIPFRNPLRPSCHVRARLNRSIRRRDNGFQFPPRFGTACHSSGDCTSLSRITIIF